MTVAYVCLASILPSSGNTILTVLGETPTFSPHRTRGVALFPGSQGVRDLGLANQNIPCSLPHDWNMDEWGPVHLAFCQTGEQIFKKTSVFFKLIYGFNIILIKVPKGFFNNKITPNFIWRTKYTLILIPPCNCLLLFFKIFLTCIAHLND